MASMTTDLASTIKLRLESMSSTRAPWVSTWTEQALNFMPRKESFSGGSAGQAKDELIFSSVPTHSLELLAASLGGLLTNPAQQWFDMRVMAPKGAQPSRELVKFLEAAQTIALEIFNSEATGFQACVHELYLDLCLFGMGVFFVEQDDENLVRFSARPLSEVYISEDSRGVVDTVFRKYKMTARQMASDWPEAISQAVKDALEKEPEKAFEVVHAVFPRSDRDPLAKVVKAKNMPIACVYMEVESRTILEETGYREFPFMVPRWSKAAGESYGRGPGLTALPAARVMHLATRDYISAAQKRTDPPLMVPDDGFLGPVDTGPGGLCYYRAGSQDRIEALPNESDLPSVLNFLQYLDSNMREMMLSNQIDDAARPPMTATESLIKQNEKMKTLAPVLGRMQSEFLTPLLRRVIAILGRAGQLPPEPAGFSWRSVRVNYTGKLARVQMQENGQALAQTIEMLAPLIGKTDPLGIMRMFQPEAIVRGIAEMNGVPSTWLGSEDDVAAARAAQDKATQGAAVDQKLQNAADIMQTAGNAKVTPDTALGALGGALGLAPQGQPGPFMSDAEGA